MNRDTHAEKLLDGAVIIRAWAEAEGFDPVDLVTICSTLIGQITATCEDPEAALEELIKQLRFATKSFAAGRSKPCAT